MRRKQLVRDWSNDTDPELRRRSRICCVSWYFLLLFCPRPVLDEVSSQRFLSFLQGCSGAELGRGTECSWPPHPLGTLSSVKVSVPLSPLLPLLSFLSALYHQPTQPCSRCALGHFPQPPCHTRVQGYVWGLSTAGKGGTVPPVLRSLRTTQNEYGLDSVGTHQF